MPANTARRTEQGVKPLFQGHKHRAPAPSIVKIIISENPPSLEDLYGPCWPLHLTDNEWSPLVSHYLLHRSPDYPSKPKEDYWIGIASTAYWCGLSMSAAVAVRWHEEYPFGSDDDVDEQGEEGEGDEMEADESNEDEEDALTTTNTDQHVSENDTIETDQAESDTDSATSVSGSASPQ